MSTLVTTTSAAPVSSSSPISIALFTDIQCDKPSSLNPNVSLALDTCAVTPGLGSLILPTVLCPNNDVQVWAFNDVGCTTTDDIFNLGDNCEGRAVSGTYHAIALSCDEDEQPTLTATTTISVASVATVAGSTHSASRSPSSTASSSSDASGWDSWPLGQQIGVPIGSLVGLLILIAVLKFILQIFFPNHPAFQSRQTRSTTTYPKYYETEVQRTTRYAMYGAMNMQNNGGGGGM